ncbi:phosphate starvation-inducible protein PhoH [Paramaledivibacter caminithermalis DSM 15212]|uniref:PhoH-like protein n=1 Tax=Paramaledivibacter caminithermalis (strain DSM 15212 / CIP 107654 / DViRD3) TaxID=1121301 RepID=A0A1M6M7E7_PARC5|nr:PhoH family protein [Paramaledivibacter caminithermalis]SHJ79342.1 phosphate starvation-inducible protein PhoH [Paramaledivibacter caminithermalis DSM 15212]
MELQNEKRIQIENIDFLDELFGNLDENIKLIEEKYGVNVVSRDGDLVILGNEESINLASKVLEKMIDMIKLGEKLDKQKVMYTMNLFNQGEGDRIDELVGGDIVCVTSRGKYIKPKTLGQRKYVNAIKNNDIVFGVGPAGTGKSYLAVAMAVKAFKNKEVSRIILTRPAVEAGESLGFLPGDLQMKVDPYLRPLYDALYDILGGDTYLKYKERGMIEVAPLAYMRGRTLDDSFIILDEAQNTTRAQMKMFLTRIGFGSKTVINGDITQMDLPKGKQSGLKQATEVLKNINGIEFIYLTDKDVVRHELVQKIIKAYDLYEKRGSKKK